MLRTLLVALCVAAGIAACFKGPLGALLFYLWLSYFRPEAWLWSNWVATFELPLVVGVTAVVMTLAFASRVRWRLGWTTGFLALLFVHSLWTAAQSSYPDWSWQWWGDFARVLVIGYLIIVNATDERRFRAILLIITVSLGLEAAKQGWAQLILHPGARNVNQHPMLGDNNGVALGMFMLLPVMVALGSTAGKIWQKWALWFLAGGVLIRGVSTYSRGGFLSLLALCVVLLIRTRRRLALGIAMVLLATGVALVMPPEFWGRMQTIETARSGEDMDDSAAGRLHFWRTALVMAESHPLTGIGFNGFARAYDTYDETRGAYGTQRAVHSMWFGALAEMGVPGLLLLVALVVQSFVHCAAVRRMAKERLVDPRLLTYANALEASLVAYVVGGTFLNAQYGEMGWHWICLTAALSAISKEASSTSTLQPPGPDRYRCERHPGGTPRSVTRITFV